MKTLPSCFAIRPGGCTHTPPDGPCARELGAPLSQAPCAAPYGLGRCEPATPGQRGDGREGERCDGRPAAGQRGCRAAVGCRSKAAAGPKAGCRRRAPPAAPLDAAWPRHAQLPASRAGGALHPRVGPMCCLCEPLHPAAPPQSGAEPTPSHFARVQVGTSSQRQKVARASPLEGVGT